MSQTTTGVERPSVPPQLIARIADVLHPEQVWLFGSRARGDARVDSDWDFMAIPANDAPEQDLDLASVWPRLRDLRLRRVEVFTMTRGEFDEWKRSLGTLAEYRRVDRCRRPWRVRFPHRCVGTR